MISWQVSPCVGALYGCIATKMWRTNNILRSFCSEGDANDETISVYNGTNGEPQKIILSQNDTAKEQNEVVRPATAPNSCER
jgi:hypothetical protein